MVPSPVSEASFKEILRVVPPRLETWDIAHQLWIAIPIEESQAEFAQTEAYVAQVNYP